MNKINRSKKINKVNKDTKTAGMNKYTKTAGIDKQTKTDGRNKQTKTNSINKQTKTNSINKQTKTNSIDKQTKTDGKNKQTKTNDINKHDKTGCLVGNRANKDIIWGKYNPVRTKNRRKLLIYTVCIWVICLVIVGRLSYLMLYQGEYYSNKAQEVQERQRKIKAPRGEILDRNGKVIASNKTVCTISVIHSQINNTNKVIDILAKELEIDKETIRRKIEKVSAVEKIKSNISKKIGDRIREYNIPGIKVDEDYKRYYPYSSLASKVLGFTGADNQGIIGLEVKYENYLKGQDGLILTPTDSRGIEQDNVSESRVEPVEGHNLITSLDVNIQQYAEQIAYNALEAKQANYVAIIVMNPTNGEILAMVNAPEFDLNNPYQLDDDADADKKQDLLNKKWRNQCINDTYEPGSTFKIVTSAAAFEEEIITLDSRFYCPGYKVVDDRRIKCHKVTGHGSETFLEELKNSCNPVFINIGLQLGPERFYKYLGKLGLMRKTGIDLPGEASTIIHNIKNVGNVEMATMSFGQSFQITPMQYLVAASAIVNGGKIVTPHLGVRSESVSGELVEKFEYKESEHVISKKTSDILKSSLEKVISEGTGSKAKVEGYRVGGKTATSQKLPRSSGKYIASFMGFAPADNPQVIAMAIVDEPKGIYYGGQVAAPLISQLYKNILPYLLEGEEQGE